MDNEMNNVTNDIEVNDIFEEEVAKALAEEPKKLKRPVRKQKK